MGIGIFHAIKSVAVEFISHSSDVESLGRTESALKRGYGGRPGFHRNIGAERNQREEVASVERQFHNALIVDYRADFRIFGVNERSTACHQHLLADFADLPDEIDTR